MLYYNTTKSSIKTLKFSNISKISNINRCSQLQSTIITRYRKKSKLSRVRHRNELACVLLEFQKYLLSQREKRRNKETSDNGNWMCAVSDRCAAFPGNGALVLSHYNIMRKVFSYILTRLKGHAFAFIKRKLSERDVHVEFQFVICKITKAFAIRGNLKCMIELFYSTMHTRMSNI